MIKETITYTDYSGVERTEDHYFNLSESELTEMSLLTDGGLDVMLEKIVNAQDTPSLMKVFKTILLKSYGVKSDDGKRFSKSEQISKEFTETEAYNKLFMSLVTDADKAAAFIQGIVPTKSVV